jgi:opacity protein-like surface antigen
MRLALIVLAVSLSAAAAQAQSVNPRTALDAAVLASGPAPQVRLTLAEPYAQAYAMKQAGVARTSVDRRLRSEDVTGSLGFLCGLQPGAERSGAAAANGYDPSGRFLGAKLSFAFR